MNVMSKPAISSIPFLQAREKKLLIGGDWVPAQSGKTFATFDPATGAELAQIAEGGAADIDRAVAAARKAFNGGWRRVKPVERQRILLRLAELVEENHEELAILETLDMGAPLLRTRARKGRALGMLRYYAGMVSSIHGETVDNSMPGEIFSFTRKEPVGVVGAIIPWNGPLAASIWKIGPAIATGCTTVFKPAEQASLVPLRLAELALEAGLPEGVLNVVTGYGETAGAALVKHNDVNKVAFTGSQATGQSIMQASAGNLKRVTLELGGKSPNIVFADADLDAAVKGSAAAIFNNSGQVCSAGSRLFVEERIYDEFMERLAAHTRTLKVGNGLDEDTVIGPLVSAEQLRRVSGYLDLGKAQGAELVAGGGRLGGAGYDEGHFIEPTIFGRVRDDMRVVREEIFGPVLVATSFSTIDEAVERANDTTFGLGSGVWTRDLGKAMRMARDVQAGSVWINCYQAMDPAVPFGGYKMSGFGRESGAQHVEEFLETKSVWINAG